MLTLTADMLKPVTDAIQSNLSVLLPVGITILAIMIGVSLIPSAKCLTGDIKPFLIDLDSRKGQQGASVMVA